jgi:hypothetical protein
MAAAILIVLAVLVLALSAAAILYVVGVRSKSATVRAAARRFHHAVGNPFQLRSAGTPGAYASVLRHQGRRTGRTYQTPVWAVPTEDGFVIAHRVRVRHRLAQECVGERGCRHRSPRRDLPCRPARDRSHGQREGVFPGHAAANPSSSSHRRVSTGSAGQGRQDLRPPGRLVSRTDVAGLDGRRLARSVLLPLEQDGSRAGRKGRRR